MGNKGLVSSNWEPTSPTPVYVRSPKDWFEALIEMTL